MKGKLNLFQSTMLCWRDLQPYNAVHVVRIDQPLNAPRLDAAIGGVLEALGLTGLTLDYTRRRFEYTGGAANAELQVLPAESDPHRVLCNEIERQLNAPFPRDGRIDPFRFFAVDAGPSFELGVAYDHFIAGGDSIVVLVKRIVDRYAGQETAGIAARTLDLYPPAYARLFLRYPGKMLRGLLRLPQMAAALRRSFRPRYPGGQDPRNAFAQFRVDPPGLETMARTAKAWGVTQNDLLIAMVLQALSPVAAERRDAKRRNELAVASIVNVRRDFQPGATATFGQFLSSFRVSHPVPPGIALRQLAHDVHAETARSRREKLYLQTLLAMSLVGLTCRWLAPERRGRFLAKSYPVWAGVTPLDVDALWKEAGGAAPPAGYLRAVPTGPFAPMVVAVTTVGAALHLGITYRTAAFSREDIDKMATEILRQLTRLHP